MSTPFHSQLAILVATLLALGGCASSPKAPIQKTVPKAPVQKTVKPPPREAPTGYNAENTADCPLYLAPIFPRRAQMAGQEGWVILQYSITSSGAVRDYSVYDASPENLYDQSVLSAVERLNKLKLGAGSSDSDNEAFKAVNCRQIIRFNLGS